MEEAMTRTSTFRRLPAFAVPLLAIATGCADADMTLEPELTTSFSRAPVVISFEKEFDAAASTATLLVWQGVVEANGMTGELVSSIDLTTPGTQQTGSVLHATVRWVATGDVAFEIETTGVINFQNGAVRTNGHGISGLGAGAVVHQDGQLTGLDAEGVLRVNTGTGH
jgi:hypothetical protein